MLHGNAGRSAGAAFLPGIQGKRRLPQPDCFGLRLPFYPELRVNIAPQACLPGIQAAMFPVTWTGVHELTRTYPDWPGLTRAAMQHDEPIFTLNYYSLPGIGF